MLMQKGDSPLRDKCCREINYLRVSVTDRCNLRCIYCLPPEGVKLVPHKEVLRSEEIVRLLRAASQAGIKKVRLTGGEPLIRKGFVDLVASIKEIPGIDDLALTTNGILLPLLGGELKKAGLNRVNISLDTLDDGMYRKITRHGELGQAWNGIEKALKLGLDPVKINTVVIKGINDCEVKDIAALTLKYPLHIRFIELMPMGACEGWAVNGYMSSAEVRKIIEENLGALEQGHRTYGYGPAKYYKLSGASGTIGFIGAMSEHFCHTCNRIRLTADGMIRPCLHGSQEIDVMTALRRGAGCSELAGYFRQAVSEKPVRYFTERGWQDKKRVMSQIGG